MIARGDGIGLRWTVPRPVPDRITRRASSRQVLAPTTTAAPVTPLPARARTASAIYMYGGSFDPPHHYHLRVAGLLAAHAAASGSEPAQSLCLYIPAARSPLKQSGPHAPDVVRVRMLRAALQGTTNAAIWTDEIDRAKWQRRLVIDRPSFTIDTVTRLRSLLPKGTRLHLVIGVTRRSRSTGAAPLGALVRLALPLVLPREESARAAGLRGSRLPRRCSSGRPANSTHGRTDC